MTGSSVYPLMPESNMLISRKSFRLAQSTDTMEEEKNAIGRS